MKKKQGFTLVELLVVIAILAILVIIALPNVLRMFRNAKENTFVTEVQEILKTAEQKYISTTFTNNECTCFSSKSTDKKHNLDMSGRNNIEYYVEFNDKGEVINLIVKDDSYQFVSEGEVIKVADIGNSTSGKIKTSTPVQEGTEVPSCDTNSSITDKYYTVTYTDGVAEEVIFDDQSYTAEEGVTTPAFQFNGMSDVNPQREGYNFEGWAPTVAEIVTKDAIYTATWSLAE